MSGPTYPDDVQKALAYMNDAGWTYERLQGVLAIALQHLEQKSEPEIVLQWAEEPIEHTATRWGVRDGEWGNFEITLTVLAGDFYVVCPHCCRVCDPGIAEDGTEYRRAYFDDLRESPEALHYGVGDSHDFYCEESFLVCDRCSMRSSIPPWLDADYG
jgi:hypothetical protein